MHSVSEVFEVIDASVAPLAPAAMDLHDARGMILARPVCADADQPAFDRSAVDGFTVLSGSMPGSFRVTGEILPGAPSPAKPGPGEALRIFTGAVVPPGCGLVMVEDSAPDGNDSVVLKREPASSLVRLRGSSIRAGSLLLEPGTAIGPAAIALLASVGTTRPFVHPAPRVLHLTTGREIVAPDRRCGPGEIRDSNGPMIRALLESAAAHALPRRHVDESEDALREAVEGAGDFDILLVSGGSSVGKYDRTREGIEALGFTVLINRVNSRPGKPMILARRNRQWAFGLPGNPVAHFAAFHVFTRRVLQRMTGSAPANEIHATLTSGIPPAPDMRETFWPARLYSSNGHLQAAPRRWIDSGDLAALIGVNALIHLGPGENPGAGTTVQVLPLDSEIQ